jgi:hypothetical protein
MYFNNGEQEAIKIGIGLNIPHLYPFKNQKICPATHTIVVYEEVQTTIASFRQTMAKMWAPARCLYNKVGFQ